MRAISTFRRDDGMSTRLCRAIVALRMRASMSAIGSVMCLRSQLSVSSCQSPVPSLIAVRPAGVHGKLEARNWKLQLPAALGHAGDVPFERQLAEAEPAQRELPEEGARAAAPLTAVPQADLELRRLGFFGDRKSTRLNSSHLVISYA